jgi:aryl-phospho-beta-D-glucosidase BglC (GH1 family)
MQTYVSAMQPGWNLGNTLDAFDPNDPTGGGETSWGNPVVTQAFIQQIAAQGFKSIRIPITWNYRMGGAPNYAIDPAFMDRVQQVVDWSLQAGLYVMINVHHDAWMWISSMPTDHNAVMARYNAVWTQIADRFKNHSDKLMFESINEPEFSNVDITTLLALLNELNTSFVHLVRASGGGNAVRPLVLPTLYCNHEQVRVDSLASTLAALNDRI